MNTAKNGVEASNKKREEGGKIMIYREGHGGSYGRCWIEGDGMTFWVYTMDGRSKSGPYSSLAAAISEYNKYCS